MLRKQLRMNEQSFNRSFNRCAGDNGKICNLYPIISLPCCMYTNNIRYLFHFYASFLSSFFFISYYLMRLKNHHLAMKKRRKERDRDRVSE